MEPARDAPPYRKDIDGLRAVAVGLILLFHMATIFPSGLLGIVSGGYVGVDVFFVISGYLITGICARDAARGSFSLARFYDRRIRRILPAMIAMLAVVTAACAVLMLPHELADYSRSLIASLLSASNFFFWATAGYFDAPGETKPLLHTWSLAVEEQFYLFWPVLLLALWRRWPGQLPAAVAAVGAGSFLLNLLLVSYRPELTFYLVPTRAWEFCLGGAVALGLLPPCRGPLARNLAAALGLAAILGSAVVLTPESVFPGLNALVPCAGTALVILAGERGTSLAGAALSIPPVRFVGWISYSLYLWHWPVMVLQKMFSILPGGDAGYLVKLEVLAACLATGTASWWLVERPFRRPSARPAASFRVAGLATGLVLLAGFATAGGLPGRFSPRAVEFASFLDYAARHPPACQAGNRERAPEAALSDCLVASETRKNVLLLGDSHAAHLRAGLRTAFPELNVLTATAGGCMPRREGATGSGGCGRLYDLVYASVLKGGRIDGIVLGGRWARHDLDALRGFAGWAAEQRIPLTVFGPVVTYDQALPRLLAMGERDDDPGRAGRHVLDDRGLDAALAAAAPNARFVSLRAVMCPGGRCETTLPDGAPIQYDYGHLTEEGSVHLLRQVVEGSRLTAADLTSASR